MNIDPAKRQLKIQVLGGRAFLDHLHDSFLQSGQGTSVFTLHISFRGQRFRSRSTPCACEPDLWESFLLELHKDVTGKCACDKKTVYIQLLDRPRCHRVYSTLGYV